MASKAAAQSLVCLQCRRTLSVKPTITLLGFQAFSCPACSADSVSPLAPPYRKSYQIATPIVMLMTLIGLWTGKPLVPGIGFLVMAYALLRDRGLVRAVKEIVESKPGE